MAERIDENIFSQNSSYYFNKENIGGDFYNQNGPTKQMLSQYNSTQNQQKLQGNQLVHSNNIPACPTNSSQQSNRFFGRDLSNYQHFNQQSFNSKQVGLGQHSNSRCVSRDQKTSNRSQTYQVPQKPKNYPQQNINQHVVLEKSGDSTKIVRNKISPFTCNIPENVTTSDFNMDVETVGHFPFSQKSSYCFPTSSNNPQYLQSLPTQSYHTIPTNTLFNNNPIQHTQSMNLQSFESDQPTKIKQNQSLHQNKQIIFNSFNTISSPQLRRYASNQITIVDEGIIESPDSKKNNNKPELVPQYAKEIFDYLRENEKKHICQTPYFEQQRQPDLNSRMRTILIDWLIDVHLKFDLLTETLFLTVNIIDRYLEKGPKVEKQKFQLVGIAALFIACKYEEIYPPDVKDFTYVCDNAFTQQELFECEGVILQTLNFNITTPSSFRFLERYSSIAEYDQRQFFTALYFLEISLVDYAGTKCTPSQLACGAMLITNIIFNNPQPWSDTLAKNTKYEQAQLIPVVAQICEIHKKTELRERQISDKEKQLNAVKRKFSQQRFDSVYAGISQFFSFSFASQTPSNNNV